MRLTFTAVIGNDPIDSSVTADCTTAKQAAKTARSYAEFGEIITVTGLRGTTKWKAVGTGALATVWKVRQ